MDKTELKSVIECLVFVADGPIRAERIAELVGEEPKDVLQILEDLGEEYRRAGRGLILVRVAEGYQFRTRPEYSDWIRKLNRSRPFRFSAPALETLAIIAYRQPITRAEIEFLRGVDSGGVMKTLLDKQLIRILGKKDVPGRPLIYGTSAEFLQFFGLSSLADLPALKEFSELRPELDSGEDAEDGSEDSRVESA